MPEYRLTLDPHNPGQFFACCGLFELSELVAPGGEAWFADEGREFAVSTDAPVPPQELTLVPREGEPGDLTLEPLELATRGHTLTLNWWLNDTLSDKSAFKSWGGRQEPRKHLLGPLLARLGSGVSASSMLSASAYTTERFGFDPRSAWDALTVGYAPNDERRKADKQALTFPWVEVLAAVGLQGFRPQPVAERRFRYRYAAWFVPLALAPARAAFAAPWRGLPSRRFEFPIVVRGQGYKTFLFAEGADHV